MMEKRAPSPIFMETTSLHKHSSSFDKMANHIKELHSGDVSKNKKQENPLPKMEMPQSYKMHTFKK